MLAASLEDGFLAVEGEPEGDDLGLVRAVAKGDKVAFESLFRLYHKRVFMFASRMLHDHVLAEEVACDTLYAVWNSAAKFREQSAVSSWIMGIAYRRSLKSFNKNARHTDNRAPAEQIDNIAESSTASNPESSANDAMEIDQISKALATLSADHRAVLELIALGHSGPEIATIVGCPENTVKTRAFHARRHLRAAIGDQ